MVLIDGALICTQYRTGKTDRRNYSGKHRSHGLHFLAVTDEHGRLIWISAARTTTSWPICAPSALGPMPTSVSAAWTTTCSTS